MGFFKVAICDDDGEFVDKLVQRISEIMKQIGAEYDMVEFYDGNELVSYCKKNVVDIVLADIDMPTMSGFKAVEELQKLQPELAVVFVTAHNELAYQAYDYHPYQFVSKTDMGKLGVVMSGLINKITRRRKNNEIVHIQLENIIDINVNEVMYFKSKRNYIVAYATDGEIIDIRGGIKSVYEQLVDFGFIYVHRSYVINCRFILDFGSRIIILRNNQEIPVTRDTKVRQEAQRIYGKFKRELRW